MELFTYKRGVLFLFFCTLLSCFFISLYHYYHSSYLIVYWILCGLLVGLFFYSKSYAIPYASAWQIAGLTGIYFLLLCSWGITYYLRFAIFPFATLVFLYNGIVLYNQATKIWRIATIICFAISALSILPILFYLSEKSLLTRPLLYTIFLSNKQEIREYLLGKISVLHILVILVFIFLTVAFFRKRIPADYVKENKLRFVKYSYVLAFLLFIFSGPIGEFLSEYSEYKNDQNQLKETILNRQKNLKNIDFKVATTKNSPHKVMIIIGESLNRQYMNIYGYSKNTTPMLKQIDSGSIDGKLFTFDNIISPEATTIPALKKVLTDINNENNIPFEKCVTIVDLFKRAGYNTFWLSNQVNLREFDSSNAAVSSSADQNYFTSSKPSIKNNGNHFDSELLPLVDAYNKQFKTSNKEVFFIHLQGSHWNYSDRYPANFNVFKSKKTNDVDSYLNTVLFNVYIVSQLMKKAISNKFDLVCYFSDHGEDMVYQHNPENYTKNMSTIPFMVLLSTKYLKDHNEIADELSKNTHTPAMTDNFFQVIQTLTEIKSTLYDPSASFISDSYIRKKRKVLDNSIPFD
jgi:heptose-I-phosphate ethanolaminephosphotransferase